MYVCVCVFLFLSFCKNKNTKYIDSHKKCKLIGQVKVIAKSTNYNLIFPQLLTGISSNFDFYWQWERKEILFIRFSKLVFMCKNNNGSHKIRLVIFYCNYINNQVRSKNTYNNVISLFFLVQDFVHVENYFKRLFVCRSESIFWFWYCGARLASTCTYMYRAHARVHITHTHRNDLNYTNSRACKSIHVHRAYRVYGTNWGELLVRFRKKGSRRFCTDVTGADDPIVPLRTKIPETGCESSKRIARCSRIVYARDMRSWRIVVTNIVLFLNSIHGFYFVHLFY